MADLYEEIGDIAEVEDDNYIFINEQGEALLRQELKCKWVDYPNKKIHILVSPSDSLSYVKALIMVSMEKFQLFSGIKTAKVSKLFTSHQVLPDKGTISEFLTPDQPLFFEVTTSDIWLEVMLEMKNLNSVLFFEIKTSMEGKISALKTFFVSLLNQVLENRGNLTRYDEEMVDLRQIVLADENFLGYELRGMVLNQNSKVVQMNDLNEDNCVKDYFNLKNRAVVCAPELKKILSGKGKGQEIREGYHPCFLHVLRNNDLGFNVRNARIELKSLVRVHKNGNNGIKRKPTLKDEKSEACSCLLF